MKIVKNQFKWHSTILDQFTKIISNVFWIAYEGGKGYGTNPRVSQQVRGKRKQYFKSISFLPLENRVMPSLLKKGGQTPLAPPDFQKGG